MLTGHQFPAKKLLVISSGIIVVLFGIIVILIMRMERLRHSLEPPTLAEADSAALRQLQAFGSILDDYGWTIHWNEPRRYEREGALHLQRGGFHSGFSDHEGEPVQIGIDALTFAEDATLPPVEPFPLEKWRDLHPVQSFGDGEGFLWTAKSSGRTFFVFYQYRDAVPSELPSQFEAYLHGDSKQRAAFRRELAQAYQAKKQTRAAIETIQAALLEAELFQGEVNGINDWRTKHALQRFLRAQGFYSGDIDGVFGNRTLKALHAFRAGAGLDKSDAIDPELAEAIAKAVRPADSELDDTLSDTVQSP